MLRARALALLILATAFAGCVIEEDADDINGERIAKKVDVRLDESTADAERFEDVVQTSLEYTHAGDPIDPTDVRVEYTDTDGERVVESLDHHTFDARLEAGDLVTIPNVNLTSGLIVKHGSTVLAERSGLSESWLRVEGHPIPISTTKTGVARYALSQQAQVEFAAQNLTLEEVDDDEEPVLVESIEALLAAGLQGSLSAETTRSVLGPRLAIDAALVASVDAEFNSVRHDNGSRIEEGARVDVDGDVATQLVLNFDRERELRSVGHSASVHFDGDVVAWDETHLRSENWRPEDVEHPLMEHVEAYEEDDVDFDPDDVDAVARTFLNRLWNARIGVGDEYALRAAFGDEDDDSMVRFEYVLQVTSRETRRVGAGSFDAFRIAQGVNLVVKAPGTDRRDFSLEDSTLWVSADSYLPLFEQATFTKSFDRDDFGDVLDAVGEDAPFSLDDDAQLVFQAESTVELAEYSGDLMLAPVLTVGGLTGLAQLGIAGGTTSVFLDQVGGSEWEDVPSVPAFDVSVDEYADRFTVVAHSGGAEWSRLELQPDQDVRFRVNGAADSTAVFAPAYLWTSLAYVEAPMHAGDFVEFCGADGSLSNVVIDIRDSDAYVLVKEGLTLASVAACP